MPQIRLRNSANVLKSPSRVRVRDGSNELRSIHRIMVRDQTNTLRLVWQTFTAEATPANVAGFSNTGAAVNITTGSTIAATVGGTSPFTYAWSQYEASAYTWTIGSPSAATTNFTAASVPAGVATSCIFQVTITDAAGAHATALVEAVVNNGQPYSPTPRLREGEVIP